MNFDLKRRLAAEFLGKLFLLAAVVGSGIAAAKLSGGNGGLALLANAIATGAALYVLISILAPISGAHFNPIVTAVFSSRGEVSRTDAAFYLLAQVLGAIMGVLLAHAMFDLPFIQV